MGDHPFAEHPAPETLLPGVLERLDRLDTTLYERPSVDVALARASDERWEMRAAALHALGRARGPAALDALTNGLADEHPAVRATAVRALGRRGNRVPLDRLLTAARDGEPEVREAAAEALGTFRGASLPGPKAATGRVRAASGTLRHFWLVLARQPAIFQRNWLLSALTLLLANGLVLLLASMLRWSLRDSATLLNLTTTLCAALGIAHSANQAYDEAAEVTLATGTSARVVLLSRLLTVVVATSAIAGVASSALGLVYGRSVWDIVQLWLGPVVLIGSLTLTLTLWVGSWVSMLLVAAVEAAQTFHIGAQGDLGLAEHPFLWQTSPAILCLALLCLVVALVATPRQIGFPRVVRDG